MLDKWNVLDPRQTNTRHDEPLTDEQQTRESLDIINIRQNKYKLHLVFVTFRICHDECLSVCLNEKEAQLFYNMINVLKGIQIK